MLTEEKNLLPFKKLIYSSESRMAKDSSLFRAKKKYKIRLFLVPQQNSCLFHLLKVRFNCVNALYEDYCSIKGYLNAPLPLNRNKYNKKW